MVESKQIKWTEKQIKQAKYTKRFLNFDDLKLWANENDSGINFMHWHQQANKERKNQNDCIASFQLNYFIFLRLYLIAFQSPIYTVDSFVFSFISLFRSHHRLFNRLSFQFHFDLFAAFKTQKKIALLLYFETIGAKRTRAHNVHRANRFKWTELY